MSILGMEKPPSLKLKNFTLSFGVQLLKAMGDESRLRILHLLFHKGELSITDLELILDFTQTKTARLVGILKQANLVQSHRNDHWVFYKVKEEAIEILRFWFEFVEKEAVLIKDISNYEALNSNRELSINKLSLKQYKPANN
jgi:ArsR family transcriptional regulator